MVLQYFGKARSIEAVTNALGTSEGSGTKETAMKRLLRSRGLRISKVQGIRGIERAIQNEWPVIAWMYNSALDEDHWLVVYGYTRSHIWVLDPSPRKTLGIQVSRAVFNRRWSGSAFSVGQR